METKANSEEVLKVLYLEDSPIDAELISEILADAGFVMSIDCVGTEKDFVSSVMKKQYDIILSDYNLPGFYAPAALSIAQKICPDVPFICVSGAIGEDTAVELLKIGAIDYVSKDKLKRLPFSVKRAISESRELKEKKKAEEKLIQMNQELIKLNAEKDKFFSVMSHDLKSPFNCLLGLSRMLADDIENLTLEEIQEMANNMHSVASNLFKLLENLLEWSRIQRGLVQFSPRVCILSEIINENMGIHSLQASQKGLDIINSISPGTLIYADFQMMNAIIRNLLSNAIKYSHMNSSIIIFSRESNENEMEIAIKDTGIGMSKETKEKLFSLGLVNSGNGTDGETGTGLGLLLCKEYIGKHNGKIWVESEEGKGSTFYLSLPVRQ
jgi:signal transduction histidine kinase